MSEDQLAEFAASLKLDQPCDAVTLRKIARDLIAARGILVHFVREAIRRHCPDADADRILAEACYEFGRYNSRRFPVCAGAEDFLRTISSKVGTLAWDQELVELSADRAEKRFASCPHADALLELGHTPEETGRICRNIMMHADFGMVSRFSHLELCFPEATVAEGGSHCRMVITRRRDGGGSEEETPVD